MIFPPRTFRGLLYTFAAVGLDTLARKAWAGADKHEQHASIVGRILDNTPASWRLFNGGK